MAITVQQQPILHSPVSNPLDFVVTSTNTGQSNFRYVCDVYIKGVSSPTFFRFFADKDPQFSSGHFDVHRVIENFVSGDISYSDYGFQTNPNSYKEYQCVFGEAYGPSSGVVTYANLTSGTVSYAWNSSMDFIQFKNYLSGDYLLAGGNQKKFLTAQTNPVNEIGFNDYTENAWLYMMAQGTTDVNRMRIKTYDSSGTLIQTVDITNPYYGLTGQINRFLRFSSGTAQLNLIAASLITSGAQPIITASVAKYTLQTFNATPTLSSELFTYKIVDKCTKDSRVRLHFFNKLGGFDSFTFHASNSQSADINRSKYKRIMGGMSSANSWAYNKSDSLDINYDVNIKDRIHLVSGWMSEDDNEWLEELITSPWILLDDVTDGFISVNIVDTKYNRKKEFNIKVINIEIDIEYTYNRYRQRF